MFQTLEVRKSNIDIYYAISSYSMSVIRLLLICYAGVVIITSSPLFKEITIFCILLAIVFDYYDGILFNKSTFSTISFYRIRRRLLDSFVDRLIIHIGCISLLVVDSSFIWFYLLILGREIVISGYCAIAFKKRIIIYPKTIAKIATLLVGLTVIAYLTANIVLSAVIAGTMIVMSFFALREYNNSLNDYYNNGNINSSLNITEII